MGSAIEASRSTYGFSILKNISVVNLQYLHYISISRYYLTYRRNMAYFKKDF
jgi:hypothetical protein